MKIKKENVKDILGLSNIQEGIMFECLNKGHTNLYVNTLIMNIRGKINVDDFRDSLKRVVDRNDILKTLFKWKNIKHPVQIVLKDYTPIFEYYNIENEISKNTQIKTVIDNYINETFDFSGVMNKFILIKKSELEYIFIFKYHHILLDGWSLSIIIEEIMQTYNDINKDKSLLITEKVSYKEYIKYLKNRNIENEEKYWTHELKDIEPCIIKKITPFSRNDKIKEEDDSSVCCKLNKEKTEKIQTFAKTNRYTLASILYSAWAVVLSKYTNSQNVSFGTVVSGRNVEIKNIKEIVGPLINTIPFNVNITNCMKYQELIDLVFNKLADRIEFENTPIVDINKYINTSEKLFNSIIAIENYPINTKLLNSNDVQIENIEMHENTNYDITIIITMLNNISIQIKYDNNKYDKVFVEGILNSYVTAISNIIDNKEQLVNSNNILSDQELDLVINKFNATKVNYNNYQLIYSQFEEKVKEVPSNIAIYDDKIKLTYEELNNRANALASYINSMYKENGHIAVYMKRSIDVVISLLAILKSGHTYVPIDTNMPINRVNKIIEQLKDPLIITEPTYLEIIKDVIDFDNILLLEKLNEHNKYNNYINTFELSDYDKYSKTNLTIRSNPSDIAYIIFTSGSTGEPKGVEIKHYSAVNLINWVNNTYKINSNDKILFITSIGFDLSVYDIFGILSSGAQIRLVHSEDTTNPKKLLSIIQNERITFWDSAPAAMSQIIPYLNNKTDINQSLRLVFLSGDWIPLNMPNILMSAFSNVHVVSLGGATEASIWSNYYDIDHVNSLWNSIPYGKPIANCGYYILDNNLNPCPIGVEGELYIGGICTAKGYLNNKELTSERFIENPYKADDIIYKTGDLARWYRNGNIEFLGRKDFQVKIRGYRVELGEIEAKLLDYKDIKSVIVTTRKIKDQNSLVAYYTADEIIQTSKLKDYLAESLPYYMIPYIFIKIDEIPITINGKVDLKKLDENFKNNNIKDSIKPKTDAELAIYEVFKEVLGINEISVDDNFFDLGGNSISVISVASLLSNKLSLNIEVTDIFRYPSIKMLTDHFARGDMNKRTEETKSQIEIHSPTSTNKDIAVIGMACRFPNAKNVDEYWENILNGTECIKHFTEKELEEYGIEPELINSSNYIRAKGYLDDTDKFDYELFGYTPKEANIMDPQIRLLHQIVWEVMEDAGYDFMNYENKIGIFVGSNSNILWINKFVNENNLGTEQYDSFILNDRDFLASRIAYKFNLKGPAISMNTACSTSLVAIDMACEALLNNKCKMILAGGIGLTYPLKSGYLYEEGMISSPDGHCRPFDNNSKGTVSGNGGGIVLLKKLDDAIKDKDNIYAIIKGTASNNDGSRKVGYTAPSIEGQIEVISSAKEKAMIDYEDIDYVETHGTGTTLGDPIEFASLKAAFNTKRKNYCKLGSVKANIGHLDSASGIASFIKSVLMVNNKILVPMTNFNEINSKIDIKNSPFYINKDMEIYDKEKPMTVAINSLGIGGTNAHVIIQEYKNKKTEVTDNDYHIVPFSANKKEILIENINKMKNYIKEKRNINLADLSYTLQEGRHKLKYRTSFVCKSTEDLYDLMCSSEVQIEMADNKKPKIIFMFPGQGSQYINMGIDLYKNEVVFRNELNKCFKIIKDITGEDYSKFIYSNYDNSEFRESTKIVQPLLVSFEYSLAKLLMSKNILPDKLIGHSLGEYTAACISGALNIENMLKLVIYRAKLMEKTDDGLMLSINMSEEETVELLKTKEFIATVNSPTNCVISARASKISDIITILDANNVKYKKLKNIKAFHSETMNCILNEFENFLENIEFNDIKIPFISNVTGEEITNNQIQNPKYWSTHLRNKVRFSDGIKLLTENPNLFFIEVGPGFTLSSFVKQHNIPNSNTINLIRHYKNETNDCKYFKESISKLWCKGFDVTWNKVDYKEKVNRISLPKYEFEKLIVNNGCLNKIQNCSSLNINKITNSYYYSKNMNIIIEIFKDIIGKEDISTNDNFFELGGDSLKGTILISKLNKNLDVKITIDDLFKYPTPILIEQLIDKTKEQKFEAISKTEIRDYYPLSSAQRRMFITSLNEENNTSYNIPFIIKMTGQLNYNKVFNTISKLILRHESLRTRFKVEGTEPVQYIQENNNSLEYKQCTSNEIDKLIKEFVKPFDIQEEDLFRCQIVNITDKDDVNYLLIDMHHIISDGISTSILTKEFIDLYLGKELDELDIQYKDYAVWQNKRLKSKELIKQNKYWLDKFKDPITRIDFSNIKEKEESKYIKGESLYFDIPSNLMEKLKEYSSANNCTLFILMFSCYALLVSKFSHKSDIIIGTPVAGRNYDKLEKIVGNFINTIPLRVNIVENSKFEDYLQEVKNVCIEAFDNQDYPLEQLTQELKDNKKLLHNQLFNNMFVLQNMEKQTLEFDNLVIESIEPPNSYSKYNITMEIREIQDKYSIKLEYCTELFNKEFINTFVSNYFDILNKCVCKNNDEILKSNYLQNNDQLLGIGEINNNYPLDKTIIELFEEQVLKTPENIAVIYENKKITYLELNKKANSLARRLRNLGVKPGDYIAIITKRSIEMIIGIYAIIKSGAAYVPIDPEYPEERINYIIEDIKPKVILCEDNLLQLSCDYILDLTDELNYKENTDNLPIVNGPDDILYVIYTSGTTGNPKGVMVSNKGIVNRIMWMNKEYPLTTDDTILQKTTYTFDVSVWEIFWWSLIGAKVVMLKQGFEKDAYKICETIKENKVSVIHFVPSMLKMFLLNLKYNPEDIEKLSSLKYVFSSGEALQGSTVEDFYKFINDVKLINLYGPTEASIDVTYFDCSNYAGKVYIGKPIDNIQIYILDKNNKICSSNELGELAIAGIGLAKGYVNRDDLTSMKFKDNPFGKGKLYYTGDLAKFTNDGYIEYLGRIDEQVKIRGFRIELQEIDSLIRKIDYVENSAVVVKELNEDKCLCAYIVSKQKINPKSIKDILSKSLPDYMIPTYIMQIDEIPVNRNGKLDKKSLPNIVVSDYQNFKKPTNIIEKKLCQFFEEVLNVKGIGVLDDFFELGGQSIKAAILIAKIKKEFNVRITFKDIFDFTNVKLLSELINSKNNVYLTESSVSKDSSDEFKLSSAQKRIYMSEIFLKDNSYMIPLVVKIKGKVNYSMIKKAFLEVINRHEALRTSIYMKNGEFYQRVNKEMSAIDFEYCESFETNVNQYLDQLNEKFDLNSPSLFRGKLIKLLETSDSYILMINVHHIVCDGISMNIIMEEMISVYGNTPLQPVEYQYKDYCLEEQDSILLNKLKEKENYWISLFKKDSYNANLITDYPRSKIRSIEGESITFNLSSELVNKLNRFISDNNITKHMLFTSVLNVLLLTYYDNKNYNIGMPVSGRSYKYTNTIGMFANTIVFKNYIDDNISFKNYIKIIKNKLLEAYDNQEFTYDMLVSKLNKSRNLSRNFLFDVFLVYNNVSINRENKNIDFEIIPYEYKDKTSKFDLIFNFTEFEDDNLELNIQYSKSLFKQSTIEKMCKKYFEIINIILEDFNIQIEEITEKIGRGN